MPTQVYGPPTEVKVPELNFQDYNAYLEDEKKFIEDLRAFCIGQKNGKNVGEVLQFPMGDGYAKYMVASMRPLELIHIPTGDAWEFPYVHLLTAEEVQKKIDAQKSLDKFFSK